MSDRISVGETLKARASQIFESGRDDLTSPLRPLRLRARRIHKLSCAPKFTPLANKVDAEPLIKGQFTYSGQDLTLASGSEPWSTPVPSESFADQLHRFGWLFPLAARNDVDARACAQHLVDSWIAVYGKWNSFSWQPDITADRLYALLSTWKTLLATDNAAEATRRVNLDRQARHLKAKFKSISVGVPRIRAAVALAMAGAMMDQTALLDKSLDQLDDELELQVLGDGGHISRQPQATAIILEMLLILESTLEVKGVQGSAQTRRAIDRLAPALDFFTHADGKLASFHGNGEFDKKTIKTLLKKAKFSSKAFSYMPHSKFQRLGVNGTILLMDTGDSPPRPFDSAAHLSPLAFELSSPSGRLIVNCGFNVERDKSQPEKWRASMRETAAHSALIIDDCSIGEIVTSSVFGSVIGKGVGIVKASRKEADGGVWLETQHDGYQASTGLSHMRRIYIDAMGVDIRGEDRLAVAMGRAPLHMNASFPYAIRFHIHPDVRVTLARDLKSALLIMPNGDGWRFRTDRGPLALEKSVYLGRGAVPERSEQLVISSEALSDNDGEDRSNRVRWSFKRLGKVGDA